MGCKELEEGFRLCPHAGEPGVAVCGEVRFVAVAAGEGGAGEVVEPVQGVLRALHGDMEALADGCKGRGFCQCGEQLQAVRLGKRDAVHADFGGRRGDRRRAHRLQARLLAVTVHLPDGIAERFGIGGVVGDEDERHAVFAL